MERITCEAGSFAIGAQSRARHLMVLLQGDLKVELVGDSSQETVLVAPGDAIGELSILTDKPSQLAFGELLVRTWAQERLLSLYFCLFFRRPAPRGL